ncbi:type I phosphomannose isomerase catalytic subunit [Bacteroidota bacterium]
MKNNIGILKFDPIFQYRIWGGEKLKNVLGKSYTESNIGESWEISGVKGNQTIVSDGNFKGKTLPALINLFGSELVGDKCYQEYGNEFPILIKFIDAKTPLSVQVHPDDILAKERHNSLGKNEMWFIMDADDKADLLIGFKEELDKKKYIDHVEKGDLMSVLNTFTVNKGELYYLPAGRVHAIGQGIMLAEIQQTSDVTYRVYDYDRVDSKTGKKRELHVGQSIDAIDFSLVDNYETTYDKKENQSNLMIDTPYFKTNYISASKELKINYEENDSFKIFICTSGKGILKSASHEVSIKRGETVLLAANEEKLTISPEGSIELLEASY